MDDWDLGSERQSEVTFWSLWNPLPPPEVSAETRGPLVGGRGQEVPHSWTPHCGAWVCNPGRQPAVCPLVSGLLCV